MAIESAFNLAIESTPKAVVKGLNVKVKQTKDDVFVVSVQFSEPEPKILNDIYKEKKDEALLQYSHGYRFCTEMALVYWADQFNN